MHLIISLIAKLQETSKRKITEMQANSSNNRLPVDSPDRALSYCGIGSILYKTHDYKWALRCFLMVFTQRREIE